jgi:RNA polymerase sigma-70 factor, ECF subfamily
VSLASVSSPFSIPELIVAVRSGSPEALGALYHIHGALVFAVAHRLTQSTADAEDVVQDVFLGLPRALASYSGQGSLEGWIRKVAVRTALMRLRSGKRLGEESLDDDPGWQPQGPQSSPLESVAIERALARLEEGYRVVFVLKVIEGYEHEEIAGMLGITSELSRVRLHRARRDLMKMLHEEEK